MTRFENKTVLITGGSSGIGLAAAQRLAFEGARIVLMARDADRLRAAVAGLNGNGHEWRSVDATKEDEMAAAIASVRERIGVVHACICCAGGHLLLPFVVSKAVKFEELYRQNVISGINTIRPIVRTFPPEGGAIVLVSSVGSLRGSAGISAYAAAKGAILSLTRSLAVELAPKKIRVNAIVPGVVETPMSERFFAMLPVEQKAAIERDHLLGLGRPEDVAAAIAFLASPDAKWVTGSELLVDGGLACH